jgi:hypothetical protein
LSVLYADIALAVSIFASFGLRAFIVGERFDRALHRLDPTYRNTRDMTRGLLVDPIAGLKGLPKDYGRYYGVTFRPVGDPEVERLRRSAVRAWIESAVFGVGGMAAVGVGGALLRRVSEDFDQIVVLVVLGLLGLYWVRRLTEQLRDPDRSTMASVWMIGGIAAAGAAFVFVVSLPSLLA